MQNRKLIVVGPLLIALAVFVVVFALSRQTSALSLTASFLNYTNDTNGTRLAMFALTNHSDVTVRRWGFCRPESQKQTGFPPALQFGPDVFLTPGQSEVIAVAAPIKSEVWKVAFHCSRDGWRRRFSDWMGQRSGGVIHAVVPHRWRGLPVQSVESDWIEP
jgi:hypothetical protein